MFGKIFRACVVIAAIASSSHYAYTQSTTAENFTNVGASGAAFQKIWVGARASGMAGAFSALADDISALYWNPAGIARTKGITAGASYTGWYANINHNFIAAILPLTEKYRAAFSLTVLDYGNLRKADIPNPANAGNFNANDLAFGITLAGALTDRFSFGATVKYLRNAIEVLSADGLAFDAGSLYQTDFYKLKISLALTNLGADRSFSGNSLSILASDDRLNTTHRKLDTRLVTSDFPLPLAFRMGIATDVFQGKEENQKLNVAFEFTQNTDGPQRYNVGAEYIYSDIVALRAGYAFNHDQLGLGLGAGYKYKSEDFIGNIDFAYNTTKTFGGVYVVSVTTNFP